MLREEFADFDAFFFDLDGVIWEGDSLLPAVDKVIDLLISLNKHIYFITNASAYSRAQAVEKLHSLGLSTVKTENMFNVAYCTAQYLKRELSPGASVLNLGYVGLADELREAGFKVIDSQDMTSLQLLTQEDFEAFEVEPVEAVVVGYNPHFNYYMLSYASLAIQNGARFIATNADKHDKLGEYLVPGAGCMVSSIEAATDKKCTLIGKPNTLMINLILERDGLERSRCVMFGDKIETDILMAKNSSVFSVLMLTGVETSDSVQDSEIKPDFILEDMAQLILS
jgi:phosphoglycolate/pyridoxal phosphate phosphatase family enzyme